MAVCGCGPATTIVKRCGVAGACEMRDAEWTPAVQAKLGEFMQGVAPAQPATTLIGAPAVPAEAAAARTPAPRAAASQTRFDDRVLSSTALL
eukprot:8139391-Pyramimonas_sp.AAC.1